MAKVTAITGVDGSGYRDYGDSRRCSKEGDGMCDGGADAHSKRVEPRITVMKNTLIGRSQ